jgi:hypothetical protein
MVELWLVPQLEEDRGNKFFFQENGTRHFHYNVPVSQESFSREMEWQRQTNTVTL